MTDLTIFLFDHIMYLVGFVLSIWIFVLSRKAGYIFVSVFFLILSIQTTAIPIIKESIPLSTLAGGEPKLLFQFEALSSIPLAILVLGIVLLFRAEKNQSRTIASSESR